MILSRHHRRRSGTRVHCLQFFYNLSDPALEDALCEVESMRRFAGLGLDRRRTLGKRNAKARLAPFKAQARAKAEHPFRFIKRVFGYGTVHYRGLAKNTNRLDLLAGLTNLLIARRHLAT